MAVLIEKSVDELKASYNLKNDKPTVELVLSIRT